MPLNVRRITASLIAVLFGFISYTIAQTAPQTPKPQSDAPTQTTVTPEPAPAPRPLSPTEQMRGRISKAKAFIAVRNYNAAIGELEAIRRESNDPSVSSVTAVLLMNSYIEQGNYKRAQEMLAENFRSFKANNANASTNYSAIAGLVIKASRNQIDRYRGLGLSVAERDLPLEAVNDIEQMRLTLELVITQAKEIVTDKTHTAIAVPLLEEAVAARSTLGRDDYDARRWRDEMADIREQVAVSQSVVLNAVIDPNAIVAAEPKPTPSETVVASIEKPVAIVAPAPAPAVETTEKAVRPVRVVGDQPKKEPIAEKTIETGPYNAGSLIGYAVRQYQPVYPAAARQLRTTGVVRVEIEIDEKGEVVEVDKTSGPAMLQSAARDAIMKWRFKPIIRDGQPVRATGYINFNFSL